MNVKKMKLTKNAYIHMMKDTKFNTVSVVFVLKTPFDKSNYNSHGLIADLLTHASKEYANREVYAKKAAGLYDTIISGRSSFSGHQHNIVFTLQFISPLRIKDDEYLGDVIHFFLSSIYQPNCDSTGFESQYFEEQKALYLNQLLAIDNDKESFAANHLRDYITADSILAYRSAGEVKNIHLLSKKDVYQTYQQLIKNQVDIYVGGNFVKKDIYAFFKKTLSTLKFNKISISPSNLFVQQIPANGIYNSHFAQSQLRIRYSLPILAKDEEYYAAIVFDALFGGTPVSLLFKIVREEHNLCYQIDSSYAENYGIVDVNVGFDNANYDQLNKLIDSTLQDMIQGHIKNDDLAMVKKLIIAKYKKNSDSGFGLIGRMYFQTTYPERANDSFVEEIQAITLEQVQKVAMQMRKTVSFFVKQKEGLYDE